MTSRFQHISEGDPAVAVPQDEIEKVEFNY